MPQKSPANITVRSHGTLPDANVATRGKPRNPWPESTNKRKKAVSTRSFKKQMVEAQTPLKRFAVRLCKREDLAEDLMQETLMKAWAARTQFKPGSNFLSWAFTILRNTWLNQLRRNKKFVGEYDERAAENILSMPASQNSSMALADLQRAMSELPTDQLEALLLVGPGDHTYEEAAEILGCAAGTVKSRVSRARSVLGDIIEDGKLKMPIENTEDTTQIAAIFVEAIETIEQGGKIEDVINLER
ncbi:sigma-70 family RNA polymerase sigma factor [Erythrobacter sp. KY5]|uniref:sigma-70 family RNA polymerase sigma factor n=1 Tax=Erythrobacter sp. KY5 TaxID=2011159 RepID=UPI0013A6BBC0|nr:sigma-70 family RNA polymerase sigma factor [Erythrobacter sp. KY5]